jgi:hypothetical protein
VRQGALKINEKGVEKCAARQNPINRGNFDSAIIARPLPTVKE